MAFAQTFVMHVAAIVTGVGLGLTLRAIRQYLDEGDRW
jgi:hypothetical protein